MFFGEGNGFVEIDQTKSRVCRGFDVEDFCFRRDEGFDAFEGSFRAADGDAPVWKFVAHEAVSATVGLRGRDDFVALLERAKKCAGDGSHAGCGGDCSFRALECGDFVFCNRHCGIAVARVNVGAAFACRPEFHLFAGREGEGGSAGDVRADAGADAVLVWFAGVYCQCLRAKRSRRFVCGFTRGVLPHSKAILEAVFEAASTNLAATGESLDG